jgi:hypothetical protein
MWGGCEEASGAWDFRPAAPSLRRPHSYTLRVHVAMTIAGNVSGVARCPEVANFSTEVRNYAGCLPGPAVDNPAPSQVFVETRPTPIVAGRGGLRGREGGGVHVGRLPRRRIRTDAPSIPPGRPNRPVLALGLPPPSPLRRPLSFASVGRPSALNLARRPGHLLIIPPEPVVAGGRIVVSAPPPQAPATVLPAGGACAAHAAHAAPLGVNPAPAMLPLPAPQAPTAPTCPTSCRVTRPPNPQPVRYPATPPRHLRLPGLGLQARKKKKKKCCSGQTPRLCYPAPCYPAYTRRLAPGSASPPTAACVRPTGRTPNRRNLPSHPAREKPCSRSTPNSTLTRPSRRRGSTPRSQAPPPPVRLRTPASPSSPPPNLPGRHAPPLRRRSRRTPPRPTTPHHTASPTPSLTASKSPRQTSHPAQARPTSSQTVRARPQPLGASRSIERNKSRHQRLSLSGS